jgi:hypothetical protein
MTPAWLLPRIVSLSVAPHIMRGFCQIREIGNESVLGCGLVCGLTATVSAQAIPPPTPPNMRYLPPGAPPGYRGDRLLEGRSQYQSVDPSRFPDHVDEQGYVRGMPENPHI